MGKDKYDMLFPGYLFCRLDATNSWNIVRTPSVLRLVTFNAEVTPIPDVDIYSLRALLSCARPLRSDPFVASGESIRVVAGPLSGADGYRLTSGNSSRVAVSFDILHASVSVPLATSDEIERKTAAGSC